MFDDGSAGLGRTADAIFLPATPSGFQFSNARMLRNSLE